MAPHLLRSHLAIACLLGAAMAFGSAPAFAADEIAAPEVAIGPAAETATIDGFVTFVINDVVTLPDPVFVIASPPSSQVLPILAVFGASIALLLVVRRRLGGGASYSLARASPA